MNGFRGKCLLAACLLSAAHGVYAQGQTDRIGESANAWIALQASNSAAAPVQPMLGAEAGAAYARYLKSFDTAIPDHYGSSFENGGKPSLDVNYHDAN
ncbi:DUF3613 domain-containing protein [Caballeronia sp. BR00000012568055]|uniref:DUF3613 domain-containing protein n=1 Tax=Caballeronia sp. BR00000012568055 TaxID=2918761 RepID=UPI0023F9F563|nr:DUF3613 domain-containing protein [Caballeronia sp. BR00000012568055]